MDRTKRTHALLRQCRRHLLQQESARRKKPKGEAPRHKAVQTLQTEFYLELRDILLC